MPIVKYYTAQVCLAQGIAVLIILKTHVFQGKMQKETDTEKYIYQPFWGCLCDSSKKYYLELT